MSTFAQNPEAQSAAPGQHPRSAQHRQRARRGGGLGLRQADAIQQQIGGEAIGAKGKEAEDFRCCGGGERMGGGVPTQEVCRGKIHRGRDSGISTQGILPILPGIPSDIRFLSVGIFKGEGVLRVNIQAGNGLLKSRARIKTIGSHEPATIGAATIGACLEAIAVLETRSSPPEARIIIVLRLQIGKTRDDVKSPPAPRHCRYHWPSWRQS